MAFWRQRSGTERAPAQAEAISRSQAVIEFVMDGKVITANQKLLETFGYTLAEIQGRHHSLFVEPEMRDSAAYREFWARLNLGEFQAAEYRRIGKDGKQVWIQATYNPILDRHESAIENVSEYVNSTAASVEQQRQVTEVMSTNMKAAAVEAASITG